MRKFFATDDYRREGRLPKVWLSAVGAPYHYECSTIPAKDPDGSDGPKAVAAAEVVRGPRGE
jgi:hypothetical protein